MNNFILKADKGLGCLITLVGVITAGLILISIIYLIGQLIDYLAFYFNYLLIFLIIGGLSYIYLLHPKFTDEDSNSLTGKNRVLIALAGFLAIGMLYSFPQFFKMYNDGKYCAKVEYETLQGFSETFIPVSVENGEVVKLYWSNGGQLDNTHFAGAIVHGDGSAYFTDDRDRTFYIQLLSRGGSCTN